MAIYGVGCVFTRNGKNSSVLPDFLVNGVIGSDYSIVDAEDVHHIFRSLKAGDIVYLKEFHGKTLTILAIGVISDYDVIWKDRSGNIQPPGSIHLPADAEVLRKVKWLLPKTGDGAAILPRLSIQLKGGGNHVQGKTIYEEYRSDVIEQILKRIV